MRIPIITVIELLTAISAQNSFAQMVDYYSGRDTIKGDEIEYNIIHYDEWFILENVSDSLIHEPYRRIDTGETVSLPNGVGVMGYDEKQLNMILQQVFSEEEIKDFTKRGNSINIALMIDPQTGKIIDVGFEVGNQKRYNDPVLYSIPIQKFEQLEILLKQELMISGYQKYQNLTHVGLGIPIFLD